MNIAERHQLLLNILAEHHRASVSDLARAVGSSEMTIRRDLEILEARGALRRVYGGAVNALLSGVEPPFAVRVLQDATTKDRLAKAVMELLDDGETVTLDTGTTTVAIARAMKDRLLTVTPLSLHAAFELSTHKGIQLLMPGGQIREGELSAYGEMATRTFQDLRYDTFILGSCGVDATAGATAHNLDDVQVKRAAVRAARRVVVVATAEKLGRTTFGRICPIEDIGLVVTDASPDAAAVQELRAEGVEIQHI
jgi:DeoR/GlpR family transcriptional regulator of sugar metabolism